MPQDKTHEIKAQTVSTDVDQHTISFKVEGDDHEATLPVMDKALETLKDLKAGDRVALVCQDGQGQTIIEIRPPKFPYER